MTDGYLNFDEYIRQGEPAQRERAEAWRMDIGLQAVFFPIDNTTLLPPSGRIWRTLANVPIYACSPPFQGVMLGYREKLGNSRR